MWNTNSFLVPYINEVQDNQLNLIHPVQKTFGVNLINNQFSCDYCYDSYEVEIIETIGASKNFFQKQQNMLQNILLSSGIKPLVQVGMMIHIDFEENGLHKKGCIDQFTHKKLLTSKYDHVKKQFLSADALPNIFMHNVSYPFIPVFSNTSFIANQSKTINFMHNVKNFKAANIKPSYTTNGTNDKFTQEPFPASFTPSAAIYDNSSTKPFNETAEVKIDPSNNFFTHPSLRSEDNSLLGQNLFIFLIFIQLWIVFFVTTRKSAAIPHIESSDETSITIASSLSSNGSEEGQLCSSPPKSLRPEASASNPLKVVITGENVQLITTSSDTPSVTPTSSSSQSSLAFASPIKSNQQCYEYIPHSMTVDGPPVQRLPSPLRLDDQRQVAKAMDRAVDTPDHLLNSNLSHLTNSELDLFSSNETNYELNDTMASEKTRLHDEIGSFIGKLPSMQKDIRKTNLNVATMSLSSDICNSQLNELKRMMENLQQVVNEMSKRGGEQRTKMASIQKELRNLTASKDAMIGAVERLRITIESMQQKEQRKEKKPETMIFDKEMVELSLSREESIMVQCIKSTAQQDDAVTYKHNFFNRFVFDNANNINGWKEDKKCKIKKLTTVFESSEMNAVGKRHDCCSLSNTEHSKHNQSYTGGYLYNYKPTNSASNERNKSYLYWKWSAAAEKLMQKLKKIHNDPVAEGVEFIGFIIEMLPGVIKTWIAFSFTIPLFAMIYFLRKIVRKHRT